jgi:hypothetical protein
LGDQHSEQSRLGTADINAADVMAVDAQSGSHVPFQSSNRIEDATGSADAEWVLPGTYVRHQHVLAEARMIRQVVEDGVGLRRDADVPLFIRQGMVDRFPAPYLLLVPLPLSLALNAIDQARVSRSNSDATISKIALSKAIALGLDSRAMCDGLNGASALQGANDFAATVIVHDTTENVRMQSDAAPSIRVTVGGLPQDRRYQPPGVVGTHGQSAVEKLSRLEGGRQDEFYHGDPSRPITVVD